MPYIPKPTTKNMDKLKILRVIDSMDPSYGGPCQGIRNSIPELDALGSMNEVVSIDGENTDRSVEDSFPIHRLGPGKGPWGYSPNLLPWLKSNLSGYDVVLVHGLWQYYGYAVRKALVWLVAKNRKLPKFYIMPHGMLDPYFQRAPDRKLKAMRNLVFWNLVERRTVNSADAMLFTCQEELELARTTFSGYRPKNEINVGYGILPPQDVTDEEVRAFGQQHGLLSDEEYLLFLSRIHPKKGLLNLVKAYSAFLKTKNSLPKLLVAGPGMNDPYGTSVLNLVQNDSLLKNKVMFIGMVSGKDKWAAFTGAKAFVLPSHQENFGIAVAEALACKCPVLISDKVNIWREITEGKAGIVAEDTLEGTFSLLERFSRFSDTEIAEMKKNAFSVYRNHFTVKQAAANLLVALKDM